jgi:hypothetical protein
VTQPLRPDQPVVYRTAVDVYRTAVDVYRTAVDG